jgi:hypothetical protein
MRVPATNTPEGKREPRNFEADAFAGTLSAMKRTILAAIAAVLVLAAVSRAAQATEVGYSRKFGLGFVVGDPTGLSAKLWVGPTNALDFGLGFWGYGINDPCFANNNCPRFGYGGGAFNMDYLWQSNIVRSTAQLDWHVGGGGRFIWSRYCGNGGGCVGVEARAPIGLDLMFTNPSFLEVFFEIAPAFLFVPTFDFGFEGGLGVRFYF